MPWQKKEEKPFQNICFQFSFIFVSKLFSEWMWIWPKKEEEKPFEVRVCDMQHGY